MEFHWNFIENKKKIPTKDYVPREWKNYKKEKINYMIKLNSIL